MLASIALVALSGPQGFDRLWRQAIDSGVDGGAAVISNGQAWGTDQAPIRRVPACSVTKLMTAQVVLQLVAEKRLTLDTQVGQVLTWTPPALREISMRHLLTHTSGLPNMDKAMGEAADGVARVYLTVDPKLRPLKDRLLFLSGEKLVHPVGTNFDYNNLDYLWHQAVIENVEKRSFNQVLHRRVFGPAGMKQSLLAPWGPLPSYVTPSYQLQDGKPVPEKRFNFGVYGGAGALLTTLGDVTKWLRWSLAAPASQSPFAAKSQFGGFQGFGGYAYRSDAFGSSLEVCERPGAIANYRWQITVIPDKGLAVAAYSITDRASLGSGFEKKGVVFDLVKAALQP